MTKKPTKIPIPCLECGTLSNRNRCRFHQREWENARNAKRVMYRDPAYIAYVKDAYCQFCGTSTDLTKDHKVPIKDGGTNEATNLRTLCRSCNSGRNKKEQTN